MSKAGHFDGAVITFRREIVYGVYILDCFGGKPPRNDDEVGCFGGMAITFRREIVYGVVKVFV